MLVGVAEWFRDLLDYCCRSYGIF